MKNSYKIFLTVAFLAIFSCSGQNYSGPVVLIKTEYGDIKIMLYNETPKHRDNFLKLAKAGFYDGTLFHRVIKGFMIQGGDPSTKNAQPGEKLGKGGPGYTIDPEFNPSLIHKRGALAAARQGDNINPEKKSNGSQFYIVQGEVLPASEIPAYVENENHELPQKLMNKLALANRDSFAFYQNSNNKPAFDKLVEKIKQQAITQAKENPFRFSDLQYKTYTTVGGAPSLDGEYTVFGEVVEGMDVVDKIANSEKDANDRPLKDVKMEVKILKE